MIEAAVAGMSSPQLAWSPTPGKWSSAQILEHLSITYGGTAQLFHKLVAKGERCGGRTTAKQRLIAFVVTTLGYLPTGRQAPEFTLPSGLPPDEVLRRIRQNAVELEAALTSAELLFGSGGTIADHPILGPLSVRQWRNFHVVHTRHHLRQIARLREKLRA